MYPNIYDKYTPNLMRLNACMGKYGIPHHYSEVNVSGCKWEILVIIHLQ